MKYIINIFLAHIILSISAYSQTDTVFNQTDNNNLKQGYWKKHYPNGKLMYKGYFEDNKPKGEMRRYYESGSLQAVMIFPEDSGLVKARLFYEDGELSAEGYYLNQIKDSTWKYYSFWTGTLVSEEHFDKGKKNGIQKSYYANGNISEEIEYKKDIKDGIWNQYFEDGKKKCVTSNKNNKVDGRYEFYYPTGVIYMIGTFVENNRHGPWIFYNEEGKEKYRLHYNHGNLNKKDEQILVEKDLEFFKTVDENIGNFEDPTIEDFYNTDPY